MIDKIMELIKQLRDWDNTTPEQNRKAMLKAAAMLEATTWQPLKTAPWSKALCESKWVLLYCVPVENVYNRHRDPVQIQACRVVGLMGSTYWKTQEYVIDECVMKPTHWRPLLEAPTNKIKELRHE